MDDAAFVEAHHPFFYRVLISFRSFESGITVWLASLGVQTYTNYGIKF